MRNDCEAAGLEGAGLAAERSEDRVVQARSLWALTFIAYIVGFAHILVSARPDGKPG